jgi:hypothetical protein
MAKRIQFRRGTTAQHATFIGAPGELTVDTDRNVVIVHDGVTAGGFPSNKAQTFSGTTTFTGSVIANNAVPSTSMTTGTIVVTGGIGVSGRVYATNFVETSSIAFKEHEQPITGALDAVLNLIGMTYDRKDKSEKNEAGLIAEQVYNVLPNVVTTDENGNPYGVKYSKLVPYLIEAIKEQQKQINELKKGN